jgi:hypothetical protein
VHSQIRGLVQPRILGMSPTHFGAFSHHKVQHEHINMNLNVHKNDSVVWGTSPKHNFPTKMAHELTPNFHGVAEDFM